jgi:hypothetical protein
VEVFGGLWLQAGVEIAAGLWAPVCGQPDQPDAADNDSHDALKVFCKMQEAQA